MLWCAMFSIMYVYDSIKSLSTLHAVKTFSYNTSWYAYVNPHKNTRYLHSVIQCINLCIIAFLALRPAGATPKVIATLAVFSGLLHQMEHRLTAFFADLARGLGKFLYLSGERVMGRGYDSAVIPATKCPRPYLHW